MKELETLKNILSVFLANDVHGKVSNIGETVLFEGIPENVPYKDDLIAAGATFDISYGCWTFWVNEE